MFVFYFFVVSDCSVFVYAISVYCDEIVSSFCSLYVYCNNCVIVKAGVELACLLCRLVIDVILRNLSGW